MFFIDSKDLIYLTGLSCFELQNFRNISLSFRINFLKDSRVEECSSSWKIA